MITLYFVACLTLLALCITRNPVRTYTGQGFQPCILPELARTDAVKFAPGTYTAGLAVGQASTLTAAADVQTITFTGAPTGGTFKLTFNGVETGSITYSGTAATLAANVQAALLLLPQIGTGNVSVAANSGAPIVTFASDLANRWQPVILFSTNALTGGTAPTATVAHTTPGRGVGGEFRAYDDAQSDGTNVAKGVTQYSFTVTPDGRHYFGDVTASAAYWCAPIWIKGYFRTADITGIDANGVADLGRIVEGDVGSLSNVATVLEIN